MAEPLRPNYRLMCPGVGEYGHGLTARQIHTTSPVTGLRCCERFAMLPPEEQERTGLKIPTREVTRE